ncbi:MAG: anti-sigma factor antagonist [Spirochaetia bacterium]|jgi:anti-anti-sigma factor
MCNNDILPGFDEHSCDSLVFELQKVEGVGNCLALNLKGQIDTYSAPFFQRGTQKAIDAGFIHLILALEGVDYLSSKAVGALIQMRKTARDKGGDIVMAAVNPKVMEIFQLLNLAKFFRYTDSLDEAIAQVKSYRAITTFPMAIRCPICRIKLNALKAGRFRCPECATVLSVDDFGIVSLC